MRKSTTCIVGIEHPKGVWLGGDNAATDIDTLSIVGLAEPKVFTNGPFGFADQGSIRQGNLLQHGLLPPVPPDNADDAELYRFLVMEFMDSVRDCLQGGGVLLKGYDTDVEYAQGGFLLAIQGRLYRVEEDFGIHRSTRGYAAVGCGEFFALGALYATPDMAPKKRVKLALAAAAENSAGVAPPFDLLNVPK